MIHVLTLMTVNGHPDDECVGAGGVMARYAAEGLRVVCVVATRGEAGKIVDAALNTPENLARLGALRESELRRGLERLGVTEAYFLDYRDSGMMGTAQNQDPRSFWQADRQEACGRLVRIIREIRPDVIVAPNAYGTDGHPDHIRASQAARAAFDLAGDPSAYPEQLADTGLEPWAPSKLYEVVEQLGRAQKLRRALRARGIRGALPIAIRVARRWRPWHELERSRASRAQADPTTCVDVRAYMDVKYAAIEEHRTQIGPDSDRLTLTPDERRQVAPTEDFTLRAARISTVTPEDDLFAGLR